MTPRRVVIIGGARSGTKIFRDGLATALGAGAVPYDVNYIWRYKNESAPDDVLGPERVTPEAARFITRFVDRYARSGIVLEKTVSNALRVPFVHRVLPDAPFIHLIRDGVDAVESTRTQWLEPVDTGYLLRKARHFPLRLVAGYGRKYAASLLNRRRAEGRYGSWGVRYPGIDDDLRSRSLLEVCARQWRESVERAQTGLASIDAPVVEVRYERFVTDPVGVFGELAERLDLPSDPRRFEHAAAMITDRSLGKGARRLNDDELAAIATEIDPTLEKLGYRSAQDRRGHTDG